MFYEENQIVETNPGIFRNLKNSIFVKSSKNPGNTMSPKQHFRIRKKYLYRGCSQLSKIQELVDNRNFEELMKFHEKIYVINDKLYPVKKNCTSPGFNKPKDSFAKD
jgi:hypothetical protein